MYKIIKKENLAESVKRIVVEAPFVAVNAKAGQFVMVMADENGERIPLTLADTDKAKGLISLIFQEVGFSTKKLGCLNQGDNIFSVLGPLGKATHVEKYGDVVCIGGGVGIAEILPVSKAFKDAGNKVIGIIGARSKELLILEEEMRRACNELFITTDDGSYERRGFVTDTLKDLIEKVSKPALVYAIGPVPMMAKVAEVTKPYNIKIIVSLNPIMVDATGMCGSCRVTVAGQTKFGCVDGPEFDAHQVDFKELMQRLTLFKEQEECANKRCPKK
ncbi:MAG: sulfide/dihydroorotate dehydrogenase-like FAD/NAD-binding protein [Candidatus Omnitrophica bacterium]|nr:sulfide/dihydroorotate dehydrogenase-like FAD/NAD-binding protein [Candidatus Omnitrophota bacterium]